MFGKATDTTQSLRRLTMVTGFLTLATVPSISISSFLIGFFEEYLFAFVNNNLLRSECSGTIIFYELI